MTNTQLFIAVAIPTFAILLNYLFTRGEIKDLRQDLRSEINGVRSDLRSEINGVRASLDALRTEVQEVKVSIANLRAELYEKFALKGAPTP